MAHLYLMQNCHGLIKIGRSTDPERRRKSLESLEKCRIEIVGVQENWGDYEEEIHIEMADFHLVGEWFDGDDFTREIALIHFDFPPDTIWPFDLDQVAADEWLDRQFEWRNERFLQRRLRREIAILREAKNGCATHDRMVWMAVWLWAREKKWELRYDFRKKTYFVHKSDAESEPLPLYTTEVAAAMTLWTDEPCPISWEGSAKDCCVAVLQAELNRILQRYNDARR